MVWNRGRIGGGEPNGGEGRRITPASGHRHSQTCIGHAEAEVMADNESRAIGGEVRVCEIKMARSMNKDLLNITRGKICVARNHEAYDAAHEGRGTRSAAE